MPPFTHHIFICSNQRAATHPRGCCDPEGNDSLRDAFKKELKARGLGPLVRANSAGCLEQCEQGPTIVIYPQGVWYGGVEVEDIPRIIDRTIIAGEVIEELLIADHLLNTPDGKRAKRGDPTAS